MLDRPEQVRIPPLAPAERSDEQAAILALLRPPGPNLNIFTTLVRNLPLFERWLRFGNALLLHGLLPARDRELVILRVAWLSRCSYEWGQHVHLAADAGLTADEIERVSAGSEEDWDQFEAALLRAVDELHSDSSITDSTWAHLAERYDDKQLIELCMLVGQYHLVAFALNSLGVQIESGVAAMPTPRRTQ